MSHRGVDPVARPDPERLNRPIEARVEELPFRATERFEDVVRERALAGISLASHSHPKPGEVARSDLADDRRHPLLSARGTPRPHPQSAEGQVDVVEDDAEIIGTDAVFFAKSSNGLSGGVHVSLRQCEHRAPARNRSAPDPRLAFARPDADAFFRRQPLDDLKPRVVASRLVGGARVAETDDCAQALLLLFLFSLFLGDHLALTEDLRLGGLSLDGLGLRSGDHFQGRVRDVDDDPLRVLQDRHALGRQDR